MHEAAGLISIEGSLARPQATEQGLTSAPRAKSELRADAVRSGKSPPKKKKAKRISTGGKGKVVQSEV